MKKRGTRKATRAAPAPQGEVVQSLKTLAPEVPAAAEKVGKFPGIEISQNPKN